MHVAVAVYLSNIRSTSGNIFLADIGLVPLITSFGRRFQVNIHKAAHKKYLGSVKSCRIM